LANSAKSNASYLAIKKAQNLVKETGDLSIPLHLRNAPTKLMKDLDYGKNYKYSHDYTNNFVEQEYLPDEISGIKIYEPGINQRENQFRESLKKRWKGKYDY
jgi:putative ATPase